VGEEENIAIVREMFDDWNARHPMGPEMLDPEVHWDARNIGRRVPDLDRVYNGREAVGEFWRNWLAAWQDVHGEVQWIRACGDRVVAWLHQRMVARSTGMEFELQYAFDIIFRDGKLARVAYFLDEAEALAAVGAAPESRQ
jgi:ketosteroid isomerase-like protein